MFDYGDLYTMLMCGAAISDAKNNIDDALKQQEIEILKRDLEILKLFQVKNNIQDPELDSLIDKYQNAIDSKTNALIKSQEERREQAKTIRRVSFFIAILMVIVLVIGLSVSSYANHNGKYYCPHCDAITVVKHDICTQCGYRVLD